MQDRLAGLSKTNCSKQNTRAGGSFYERTTIMGEADAASMWPIVAARSPAAVSAEMRSE